MTLSSEFHRSKFEQAADPAPLANELARVLTERLCRAADPSVTIAGIVRELRDLGHEIYSWDASDDFETWGDSWVQPHPPKRIILDFSFREDEPRNVEVTFGPWPKNVSNEIDKLAWLYIKDKRLLAARSKGKVAYYIPGGKRESGESDQGALIREIREELSVDLLPETIEHVGEFKAQADGKPEDTLVKMTCYQADFRGEIKAAAEIEEVVWIRHEDKGRCSPVVKVILDWLKDRALIE